MNNKLFKKLNDKMEINQVKNTELTESERKMAEEKLVFGSMISDLKKNTEFSKQED